MNIDDLRDELNRRAGHVDGTRHQDRLTGVHSKVTAKRRARAAGSLGAAALTVAALVVVPQVAADMVQPDVDDPAAPTSPPTPSRRTPEPLAFPASIDGDTLLDSTMNKPGRNTLTWRVVLDRLDVLASAFCRLPKDSSYDPATRPLVGLYWAIDGRTLYGSSCSSDRPGEATQGPVPWRDYGVQPGQPFTISMWLQRAGNRIQEPRARFGLGLYALTGQRVHSDGVELPVIKDASDDHRYRLVDYRTRALVEARALSLVVPASDRPVYLVYGWSAREQVGGLGAYLDGEPLSSVTGGGLASGEIIGRTVRPHTVRVVAEGESDSGVLVIAYYERVG